MCDGGSCRIPRQTVSAIKPLLTGCAARATPATSARCSGPDSCEVPASTAVTDAPGRLRQRERLRQRMRVVAAEPGAIWIGRRRVQADDDVHDALSLAAAAGERCQARRQLVDQRVPARRPASGAGSSTSAGGAAPAPAVAPAAPAPRRRGCAASPTSRRRGCPRDHDARNRHRDRRRGRHRVDHGHAGRRGRGELRERGLAQRRIDDDQDRRQRRRGVFVDLGRELDDAHLRRRTQAITSTSTSRCRDRRARRPRAGSRPPAARARRGRGAGTTYDRRASGARRCGRRRPRAAWPPRPAPGRRWRRMRRPAAARPGPSSVPAPPAGNRTSRGGIRSTAAYRAGPWVRSRGGPPGRRPRSTAPCPRRRGPGGRRPCRPGGARSSRWRTRSRPPRARRVVPRRARTATARWGAVAEIDGNEQIRQRAPRGRNHASADGAVSIDTPIHG